jgi:hypothetical protein
MKKKMADLLQQLPTDRIPPTQEEKDMLSWLYLDPRESLRETTTKVASEMRTVFWIGVVFFFLSLPQSDAFLHSLVPMTKENTLFTSAAKTFLFVMIAWVLLNVSYLWKK